MVDRIVLCDGDDCTLGFDGRVIDFARGFLQSGIREAKRQRKSYQVNFATQRDTRALELKITSDFRSASSDPAFRFEHIRDKAKFKKELMKRYGLAGPIASMQSLDPAMPSIRVLTGEGIDQTTYESAADSQAAYDRMLERAVDNFVDRLWTPKKKRLISNIHQ